MRKITAVVMFVLTMGLVSCSGDDNNGVNPAPNDPNNPEFELPTITTQAPQLTEGNLKFNGTIVSEGDGYYERGFCWGQNTNPVIGSSSTKITADGSGTGPYFATTSIYGIAAPGQTINIRAYAYANDGSTVVYGNNITFTAPLEYEGSIETAIDIYPNQATLKGNIFSNYPFTTSIPHKGFLVSTNPTPTLSNSVQLEVTGAFGTAFTTQADNLQPNTVYYARTYGYISQSNITYSSTISFKTTGFIGQSGGYVFYDKGAASNGWRYLEASPANLTYNNGQLIKWGCTGNSIMQTSLEIGTGKENTQRILQLCTDANSAARVCDNYSVNGIDDWFLPSKYEMAAMSGALSEMINLGTETNQTYWSSSEYDGNTAHLVNAWYNFSPAFGVSKSNTNLVRAVRRF